MQRGRAYISAIGLHCRVLLRRRLDNSNSNQWPVPIWLGMSYGIIDTYPLHWRLFPGQYRPIGMHYMHCRIHMRQ